MGFGAQRVRKANPVSLEKVLGPAVRNLGLEPVVALDRLRLEWDSIVGSANARNTRPLELDKDVLIIAVSSPAWMTQTRFYKTAFIDKINALGIDGARISDIKFKLERS